MYTYTPDRKSKIEKVIKAFEPYIFQSDFFDILWSNKFGYLLVKSIGPKMDEMMCLHISSDAEGYLRQAQPDPEGDPRLSGRFPPTLICVNVCSPISLLTSLSLTNPIIS